MIIDHDCHHMMIIIINTPDSPDSLRFSSSSHKSISKGSSSLAYQIDNVCFRMDGTPMNQNNCTFSSKTVLIITCTGDNNAMVTCMGDSKERIWLPGGRNSTFARPPTWWLIYEHYDHNHELIVIMIIICLSTHLVVDEHYDHYHDYHMCVLPPGVMMSS